MAQKKFIPQVKTVDNIISEYGKLPPQAVELEEVVLGALMLERNAFDNVVEILKTDSFYKDAHKLVYQAIVNLSTKNMPIDILTVTEELKQMSKLEEAGGAYFVTYLTSRVSSAANITYHARIIAQKYIQRELIGISSEIQTRSFDETEDVSNLLEFAETALFKISEGNIKKETQHVGPLMIAALKQLEELSTKKGAFSGVPSGFTRIDHMTSGWQKSDLIVIAGRPSMGKTAFVLSMARNMGVDFKRTVAIFSLEMSSIQLINRLIIAETEVSSEKIRNGRLSKHEISYIEDKIRDLSQAQIYIDDTPAISVVELRTKCRRLKKQNENLELIIIDYMQLMSTGTDMKGNREQEVSVISRSLKALAKELDVPIIALSQLNRALERRDQRRPQLSDLRESGAIEQDADLVILIHRPEKYGQEEDQNGNSMKGIAEIIIAKHRNGATGEIRLKFREEFAKFTDLEYSELKEDTDEMFSESVTFSSKMNSNSEDNNYPAERKSRSENLKSEPPF
ncbi:MAG: replicative DNA helicase [Bacteroidia bacterium]|nr:replicative DNA helicase [Bacteroidia bacterium]